MPRAQRTPVRAAGTSRARARAPAKVVHEEQPSRRLDVDERRKQLVTLGLQLFGGRSYDEVSIDELAAAAGISKGLLYHYFPTKKDFYVATVRESARQLVERTDSARARVRDDDDSAVDPLAQLRAGLDEFLDYVIAHPRAYANLLRSGVGVDAEVAAIVDDTRTALSARLLEGTPLDATDDRVRLAVRGWLGFVEAATIEWLGGDRAVDRAVLRDLLAQVLLRSLEAAAV